MSFEFDFCIVITTYDRPKMLYNLLNSIEKENENYKLKVFLFNDCSNKEYRLTNFDVTEIKMYPNRGKEGFWEIIDKSFKVVKNIKSNYFIYLQDDVTLESNFFTKLKNEYESIKDNNKICLSFLTDSRTEKSNWGSGTPIKYDNYIRTNWVELFFISKLDFFDKLNFKINEIPKNRWKNNPTLSSGVGQQITERLNRLNYNMYHTKKSLVNHGDHISVMNPKERLKNKLITK